MERKEVFLFLFLTLVIAFMAIMGCVKDRIPCDEPYVVVGDRCCFDNNMNNVCDDATGDSCKDGDCDPWENCTNCWQDCGPCKKIIYIYVPRNFTLKEIDEEIDEVFNKHMKFRKDITALNNVSEFFYSTEVIPRLFAEFLGKQYRILYESKQVLLSEVITDEYSVNDSESLLDYVNYSNWYIIHDTLNDEREKYEKRINEGVSKKDYPTNPTGHDKEFRYADWDYRNFTKKDEVIRDSVELLPNGMVESVYAGITNYSVLYKNHEYEEELDEEIVRVLEAYRTVEEKKLNYVHAITFTCARNLAITLYNYDYDTRYLTINKDDMKEQMGVNKKALISRADDIRQMCDENFRNKVFTPN